MLAVDATPRKQRKRRTELASPRLAPPRPARTRIDDFRAAALAMDLDLMGWQDIVGRYITAIGPNGNWLYRRVAVAVARQNGKTEIIKPRTLMGLKMGRAQLHIAQDRLRPRRSTFEPLADFLNQAEQRDEYGIKAIRFANGQEQILCHNGGSYTILAPTSGGARGGSYDDIYVDEVREFETTEVEGIIRPTTTARPNAQIMYFSSAGHEASIVLNAIRERRDSDPRLAYLEWSAAPERAIDDREGWAEANPALGITISMDTLADDYASMPTVEFETEHLCRWVVSLHQAFVSEEKWQSGHIKLGNPVRPSFAVSMDAAGERASAVVAWPDGPNSVAVRVVADVHGSPVDPDLLGPEWKQLAVKLGASGPGYDPWTDADLARHFKKPESINGRDYANASGKFATLVEAGHIHWDQADPITTDLAWTVQRQHESGAWSAVRAKDDRPITAVLAAIRAVWLASGPRPTTARIL